MHDTNFLVTVIMGVLTKSGGGIIRDAFSGEIPLFFRREIYATASLVGGFSYFLFLAAGLVDGSAMSGGASVTLCIRLAATHWGLALPNLSRYAEGSGDRG